MDKESIKLNGLLNYQKKLIRKVTEASKDNPTLRIVMPPNNGKNEAEKQFQEWRKEQ